jgi:hypothetical protein
MYEVCLTKWDVIPGAGPWCVRGSAAHGVGDHQFMPESSAGTQP